VIADSSRALQAEVCGKAFKGAETLYTLRLPSGTRVLSLAPSGHDLPVGSRVGVRVDAERVAAFPIE
jgi:iron(III) transport system ATP-binding protein